jgi:hypothetical protein
LLSAERTSHAAYLASLASAAIAPAFTCYTQPNAPLPDDSLLHAALTNCISVLNDISSSSSSEAKQQKQKLLPSSASSFFSFYSSAKSKVSISSLQHDFNVQATQLLFDAAVKSAREANDTHTVARLQSLTAPHAYDWKLAVPTSSLLTLPNPHYRLAARLNLGLQPFPLLPNDCQSCGKQNQTAKDAWHYLSCNVMKRKELNMRHNAVLNALYLYTSRAGGVAVKEPTDLNDKDGRRPDLQLLLPGLHYLADVRITHPLCPTHVQAAANKQLGAALRAEREKQIDTNRQQSNIMLSSFLLLWKPLVELHLLL